MSYNSNKYSNKIRINSIKAFKTKIYLDHLIANKLSIILGCQEYIDQKLELS